MKKKWPFWAILGLSILIFLTLVKAILLPFVLGIMVAYFLDPLADRLEKYGLSRQTATLVITTIFFSIITISLIILVPILYQQLESLLTALPKLINDKKLIPQVNHWLEGLDPNITAKITEGLQNTSITILGFVGDFIKGVMQSGFALINLLSLIFIAPVVAFYFLRDWDVMVARLYTLLPRKHLTVIKQQLSLVDKTLSGFIRGQTQVCLLLGIFYTISLSMMGLQGGALIGFLTGIATFIPYVGMIAGSAIGLIVAWFQFQSWEGVLTVAAIFIAGQVLEGNFVAPKLVGDKVGLHPVWIIFGMLAGGTLFGFLGVVIAVPVTAILGVLIKFLTAEYLKSRYYKS